MYLVGVLPSTIMLESVYVTENVEVIVEFEKITKTNMVSKVCWLKPVRDKVKATTTGCGGERATPVSRAWLVRNAN